MKVYILYRRDLFKRPHTFIHLNLCISLLLGYVVFVGGVDFATNIRVSLPNAILVDSVSTVRNNILWYIT